MPKRTDPTLDTLLDLDGFTLFFENGSWAKGRVWLIEPDEARPHGIRYELTLHDRSSRRLLGFDNAPCGDAARRQVRRAAAGI